MGEGGFGRVFRAAALPSLPGGTGEVAIKKGSSVHSDTDLNDLHREVTLLGGCSHPHLLPLLGHCLAREAPCLVFPLVRGGSLQSRLHPQGEHWLHLQRLGFSSPPAPLTWLQRLQVVCQAAEGLQYLHEAQLTKPSIVHRDFKPANILLSQQGANRP